ncbi:hypothetical protein [Pseudoduganella buxea]|uniref:Heparinase n=2 Tax=Pseudoduganella buxea TaxID=1949069 RepID=A0ABQ1K1F9_9BURK|nr:hypothetical protein [Pseudoduganella buxea]GGB83622.1 hypothetical protein GCM10011572_01930 [Pseudoduganella buxea]
MISPVLASVLASARAPLNRRIGEVRRATPGFDDAALAAFFADAIDPVVQAVAVLDEARLPAVVMAAADTALQLGVHDRALAARTAQVRDTWQALAGPCAALIAAAPAQVPGMLANAVLHVTQQGGRSGQWRDELAALAGRAADTRELAVLGQLLAWRAGLAHFRRGALTAAAGLPPALALAALKLPEAMRWEDAVATLASDPWWGPDGRADAGIETGAFAGLGGAFMAPPQVRPAHDGFFVDGGARHHLLVADRHGAVLLAASAAEYEAAPAQGGHPAVRLEGDTLQVGTRTVSLDLPAAGLRVVCNADTVAVTSPFTHTIRLLPLP